MSPIMYQLEVKLNLIQAFFNPAHGWRVTVHVDPMERGLGAQQKPEKVERTAAAFAALEALGVTIGIHDTFGRVDVVADGPDDDFHMVEVEGESRRQREQALYSALGQLVVAMDVPDGRSVHYGLAVPDGRVWRKQLAKIPVPIKKQLDLSLYAIANGGGTKWEPHEEVVTRGRA